MSGYITERDFEQAEAAFPGIVELYRTLYPAPLTFLDLLRCYRQRDALGSAHAG
jgi:hypothetical protein